MKICKRKGLNGNTRLYNENKRITEKTIVKGEASSKGK